MITISEIIDIIAMSFFIGYIFKDMFHRVPKPQHYDEYDPLKYHKETKFWDDLKHSVMIAAPAIVLHEFAHKFVAMGFGATATLHAPYFLYIIVLILRLLKFPFIFFVGGYVAHSPLPPFESAMVSIAGPLINLVLYLLCIGAVRYKWAHSKYFPMLAMSGKLNLFLCIFNMLPFPGFDGQHFFAGMWQAFL
ncbi:M50 family metallopeptidase [Candidatus Woesearchaeota archaeon]|nr:M50 family metallopeptidase [Candidatus Woesearchaeota archaeon]